MTKVDFSKHDVEYPQVLEFDLLDDGFESSVEEFTTYYHINMLGDIRERIVQAYHMVLDGTVVGLSRFRLRISSPMRQGP